MIDIRLPNITGATPQEQMAQMQSYMRQFVEQLQWALSNIDNMQQSGAYNVQQKETPSQATAYPYDIASTFAALKPLIIKSADIVNAYYEKISTRLEGVYVAVSDFGVFQEKTSQDILSNSTEIVQAFTNIQEVKTGLNTNIDSLLDEVGALDTNLQSIKEGVENNIIDITGEISKLETDIITYNDGIDNSLRDLAEDLKEVNEVLVEVNANIRSGLLYEDENGISVYGLEIGQTNTINGVEVFNKYAQFTSEKISFFDQNGTEVAYISDYKLYITNAEFTGMVKFGAFLLDTTAGFRLKWVGRG